MLETMESMQPGDGIRPAVETAALQILAPLAQLLLEAQMGIGEAAALFKTAMVHGAIARARKIGAEPPSISRIAVQTGVARAEVSEILQRAFQPRPAREGRARAERVLSGWWTDGDYQAASGRPMALNLYGEAPSLLALVERHSGTARLDPILQELRDAGAVRELRDGRFLPIKRTCVNVNWDRESITNIGTQSGRVIQASLDNLRAGGTLPMLLATAESGPIKSDHLRVLVENLIEDGRIFADGARDTLSRPRYAAAESETGKRIIVAVQVFEEPVPAASKTASGTDTSRLNKPRRASAVKKKPPRGVGAA